jgi:nicotinamidase-related amidase
MTDGDRAGLLVVDVQNDFCAGGALAVPQSDRVVHVLNEYIEEAVARGMTVYASRDWHPAVTNHFTPVRRHVAGALRPGHTWRRLSSGPPPAVDDHRRHQG